jgi:hypothetical protein
MSSELSLKLIDPQNYTQNQRAEFRLPSGNLYRSNMKLLNVGFASTTAGTDGFSYINGALVCIKQISLMDGSKVLDSINNFNLLQGFKSYNVNNMKACDLKTSLEKTKMGCTSTQDEIAINNNVQNFKAWDMYIGDADPATTERDTEKAYVDLSDLFPLLRNLGLIHTGLFKNMRIVLEFQTRDSLYQPSEPTADHQTTQPLLAIHQIENAEEAAEYLRNFKGVQYTSTENDQVTIPSVPNVSVTNLTPTQTNEFRINGFNNKTVNRMLISKNSTVPVDATPTHRTSPKYGESASQCMFSQRLQCRINGANLLPSNGITGDRQRLGALNDAYGVCVTPLGGEIPNFVDSINSYADGSQDRNDVAGRLDYYGLQTGGKRVQDLQFTYERKGVHNAADADQSKGRFNQQLRFNVLGEVIKQIRPNGRGGYSVVYV